jgi:hypothetical protein
MVGCEWAQPTSAPGMAMASRPGPRGADQAAWRGDGGERTGQPIHFPAAEFAVLHHARAPGERFDAGVGDRIRADDGIAAVVVDIHRGMGQQSEYHSRERVARLQRDAIRDTGGDVDAAGDPCQHEEAGPHGLQPGPPDAQLRAATHASVRREAGKTAWGS